jgi:demethylmenaquinone methyltransferase / 2-methoxy-6-polyprenyl-1,4-benzoquinol methylase
MSQGTTPPGAENEQQAAAWVRRMFDAVAPRYDLLNHLLSFNIDKTWRKRLMTKVRPVLSRDDAAVLDLCCGTGDVLLEMQQQSAVPMFGADFSHPMLVSAKTKLDRFNRSSALVEADAMRLPIRDGWLDLITIAFGFRNLANYETALRELRRVLKPDGVLAILEFSHPQGWLTRSSYGFYSKVLLPFIGGLISGSREAYTYLPESIRKFPRAVELQQMMEQAGFEDVSFELLTGGIAALHIGRRPEAPGSSEGLSQYTDRE